jgi:hypothetical protein
MTIRLHTLVSLLTLLGLFSCTSYSDTPEGVIREYSRKVSSGKCEEAMELCTENAKMIVQGSIDAGCEPFTSEIDSIDCGIRDSIARCICYEKREGMTVQVPYALVLEEREWKIFDLSKDSAPWDWVDKEPNWDLEN